MGKLTKKQKAARKAKATRNRNAKSKKYRVKAKPKKHLGVLLGGAATGYKTESAVDPWGSTVLAAQKNAAKAILKGDLANPWIKHAAELTVARAKENAGPALIGAAASFGEDIPVVGGMVRDVKRPLNRMMGKVETALTGKKPKWRL